MSETSNAGTIGWLDLTVGAADTVRDFYQAVVGWTPSNVDMAEGYADYTMNLPGTTTAVAGICHAQGANADLPPVWIPYFVVDDVAAAIAACRSHGGTLLREPDAEPTMALLRDPGGAVAALFKSEPRPILPYFKGVFPISGDPQNLPVKDLAPAIAFYTQVLGFQVETRTADHAALRRQDVVIGLTRNQDDPEQVSCYFSVENLDALHDELTQANLEPTDIRLDNHGGKSYRVFFAKEPYGVCFCFGEPAP